MFRRWLEELTRLVQPGQQSLTRRVLSLVGVLVVSAAVESYLVCHTEAVARDAAHYVQMARAWRAGPRDVVDRWNYHVGYPVAIVGVHDAGEALDLWTGPAGWDRAGQVVSLLGALGTVAALWAFGGLCLENWRLAWLAALLFALGRKWCLLGADVLSDALAACFQMWALVLGVLAGRALRRAQRRAVLWAGASGMCAGVGYLVRPEALVVPVVGTAVFLLCRWGRGVRWRLVGAAVAAQAALALAAAAPYMLAIGGVSKKKRLADLLMWTRGRAGGAVLASAEHGFLHKFASQFAGAMHPVLAILMLVAVVVWVLLHAGRVAMPKRPRCSSTPVAMMYQIGVLLVLGVVGAGLYRNVGYLSHRHVLLVTLALAPWSALGAAQLCATVNLACTRIPGLAWMRRVSFPVGIAMLAGGMLWHSLRPLHEGKGPFREAGLYIASRATGGDHVLTDDGRIGHYARYADDPPAVSILRRKDGSYATPLRHWLADRTVTLVVLSPNAWAHVPAEARRLLPAETSASVHCVGPDPESAVRVFWLDRKAEPTSRPPAARPAPAGAGVKPKPNHEGPGHANRAGT